MDKLQPSPDQSDIVNLIRQALEDAERQGQRFTIRGFCRQHQGILGGLGRGRLRKVIGEAIVDGRLTLEDGENANRVKVKFFKV
jgi:hypothetical protein